jgi:hypothetical protein
MNVNPPLIRLNPSNAKFGMRIRPTFDPDASATISRLEKDPTWGSVFYVNWSRECDANLINGPFTFNLDWEIMAPDSENLTSSGLLKHFPTYDDILPIIKPIRQEKPCQVCRNLNDVGVLVCYSCGNKPHD